MTFEMYWQLRVYAVVFGAGVIVGMILMYYIMKDYKKERQ